MTEQYGRKVSLILGNDRTAIDLSELHFKFQVARGDIQTPNSADIRVYNVSLDTMQKISTEFSRVLLQAGYAGNFGTIFAGSVVQLRRGRENATDTYLDITAADGDAAYNFSLVNTALAGGSSMRDQFKAVLRAMRERGVTAGSTAQLPSAKLPRGKVMFGLARDYARDLASSADSTWSIQDGEFTVIPKSAYLPGELPIITAATGMIGLPEQTQGGIKVKCLLNPNLKAGARIKLDNASIQQFRLNLDIAAFGSNLFTPTLAHDGVYKVLFAEHAGDTRGQEWYSNLTCKALGAPTPPNLLTRVPLGVD